MGYVFPVMVNTGCPLLDSSTVARILLVSSGGGTFYKHHKNSTGEWSLFVL